MLKLKKIVKAKKWPWQSLKVNVDIWLPTVVWSNHISNFIHSS